MLGFAEIMRRAAMINLAAAQRGPFHTAGAMGCGSAEAAELLAGGQRHALLRVLVFGVIALGVVGLIVHILELFMLMLLVLLVFVGFMLFGFGLGGRGRHGAACCGLGHRGQAEHARNAQRGNQFSNFLDSHVHIAPSLTRGAARV